MPSRTSSICGIVSFALLPVLLLLGPVSGVAARLDPSADDVASLFMTSKSIRTTLDSHTGNRNFTDFVQKHGHEYRVGSPEYANRLELFQKRSMQVEEHNRVLGRLWRATLNKLADRTAEELKELRGYNRHARPESTGSQGPTLLSMPSQAFNLDALPLDFSWKGKLEATTEIVDQSACGSCWAFASATVIRAHSELFQKDWRLSVQQIVSCTPNPQECGGKGGCTGATAELAMDYVARAGRVLTEAEFPYNATEQACPEALKIKTPMDTAAIEGPTLHQLSGAGGTRFGMTGFQKLPENQLEPIFFALTNLGPLPIGISAGDGWNMYDHGIYDSCVKDAVIDHAVMLTGWGQDSADSKYWLVQNSWGPSWGEGGNIRLFRRDHSNEKQYCGWDNSPEIGNGCKGGPASVYVCGTCGLLYDVVVPTFQMASGSWWAIHGGRSHEASVSDVY